MFVVTNIYRRYDRQNLIYVGSHNFYPKLFISGNIHSITHSNLFILFVIGLTIGFSQATKVTITTQPVPGSGNGALMPVQPVVEIKDAGDQRITTSSAQVKIASGSGGTMGGTTTINAVNGVATFIDLTFSVSIESVGKEFTNLIRGKMPAALLNHKKDISNIHFPFPFCTALPSQPDPHSTRKMTSAHFM